MTEITTSPVISIHRSKTAEYAQLRPGKQILQSDIDHPSSPEGCRLVKTMRSEWKTYRTRFLIRAKQLDQPLTFVDCIGREHSGEAGDYLALSSDGSRRIAPREIFEDIYVPMEQPADQWPVAVELANLLPSDLLSGESFGTENELVCRTLESNSPQCLPSPSMQTQKVARRRPAERTCAS